MDDGDSHDRQSPGMTKAGIKELLRRKHHVDIVDDRNGETKSNVNSKNKLDKNEKKDVKNRLAKKKKSNNKWIVSIWIISFILSIIFSVISTSLLSSVDLIIAFLILISIIVINIFFDIIGTAVTAADATPFHSMAAKKVLGSKEALKLIKNADKVNNLCNDVIGDICGIISGSATTYIVIKVISNIANSTDTIQTVIEVLLTGVVASLTVGGKAIGKGIAIEKSNEILYNVAKIIRFFKRR